MADENKTQKSSTLGIILAVLGGAALIALVVALTLGHFRAQDEAAATASFRTTTLAKLDGIKTDTTSVIAGQVGDRQLATVRYDVLRAEHAQNLAAIHVVSDAQDAQGRKLDDLVKKADATKVVTAEIEKEIAKAAQDRATLRRKLREDRKAREAAKTPYRYRSETTVRYVRAR